MICVNGGLNMGKQALTYIMEIYKSQLKGLPDKTESQGLKRTILECTIATIEAVLQEDIEEE